MNAPTPGPKRVLIAEDDDAMRDLLVASCVDLGAIVESVADGNALKARLAGPDELPDVVVSDVRMPGASGLAVLHWLASATIDVHVVLITAFGDPRTHRRARELGAVAVLDKPFDVDDLVVLVRQLLDCDAGVVSVT